MNKKLVIFCIVVMLSMFLIMGAQAAPKTVLRVSTWGGLYQECYQATIDSFEKENNVQVEWVLGTMADWMVKARAGELDVVTTNLLNSMNGEKEGLWAELDETKIPNMAHLYDRAKYSKYTIFSNIGDYVIAYNTKHIKTAPASWDDLWDPAYKNRVVLFYFTSAGTLSLIVQQAEQRGGGIDNIDPGLNRLAELYNSNVIAMVQGDAEVQSLLQMEEAWIGMACNGRVIDLQKKGCDFLKIARPKEGTFAMISTLNVPKTSKQQDLAMKFINHVLSPEVQEVFAERTFYAPVVNNAKVPPELKDLLVSEEDVAKLYIPDLAAVNEVKAEWAERWDRLIH